MNCVGGMSERIRRHRPKLKVRRGRRHLPTGTGEFSVGCVDIMCAENPDDSLSGGVFFRLYYPTEKTDIYKRDKQWPLWLPRRQYGDGYVYFLGANPKIFGKIFNWISGNMYIPALWQAPPIQHRGRLPVIVFSHGIGGNRTTYTTMCCELASQGFIVASVEHRDGSASITYSIRGKSESDDITDETDMPTLHKCESLHLANGVVEDWKWFEKYEEWDNFDIRNKQMYHRAKECSQVLNVLTEMNEGKDIMNITGLHFDTSQFTGCLDLSKVSIIGHSFGGTTCCCTLGMDKRFKVGIALDAWMLPLDEDIYKKITQPILMLNMEKFQWKKNIIQMQQLMDETMDRIMITSRGTCHQSVTDFQFILNKPLALFGGARHTLNPHVAIDLHNKATLGFLWRHLDIPAKADYEDILTAKNNLVIWGTNVDLTS